MPSAKTVSDDGRIVAPDATELGVVAVPVDILEDDAGESGAPCLCLDPSCGVGQFDGDPAED